MPQAIDEEKLAGLQAMERNKPPMKQIEFQKYPQMIYDHKKSRAGRILTRLNQVTGQDVETHIPEKIVTKVVKDDTEFQAAIAEGWQEKPPVFPPATPIDMEQHLEERKEEKRGRGRPKLQ